MRRFRLLLGLLTAAAAVALAIAAGGWLPIMLGFVAALIIADVLVNLPHPRDRTSPEVTAYVREIRQLIAPEMRAVRPGTDT